MLGIQRQTEILIQCQIAHTQCVCNSVQVLTVGETGRPGRIAENGKVMLLYLEPIQYGGKI